MICTIEWKNFSPQDWQARYKKLRQSNLLQSYLYGNALYTLKQQKKRHGLIKINGQEAGIVQIIEAGILGNAIHGVILDRGPLWFEGFGTDECMAAFLRTFNKNFPRRLGRKRRIIPEMQDTEKAQTMMNETGYKRASETGYQTIWLDLEKDPGVLMAAMNKNWQRSLKKAQDSDLETQWDWEGKHFSWFLKVHGLDKSKRHYGGPEPDFVKVLAENFAVGGDMVLGRAMLYGKPVAAVLILCHGQSATYQAGWNGPEGRDMRAHHLLFWDAVSVLKEKGIRDFDLGGVNDQKAAGVKQFKLGLGGELVQLVGHYT